MIKTVTTLKWQWAGRIRRRDDGKWTGRVTDVERSRGRPSTRWCDEMKFTERVHRNWKLEALSRSERKCVGVSCVLQWNYTD